MKHVNTTTQPEACSLTWDQWKAEALNRLFQEYGKTGKFCRSTPFIAQIRPGVSQRNQSRRQHP